MVEDDRVPMLYFVVSGAPLTRYVHHGVQLAHERGYQAAVVPTQAAEAWLNRDILETLGVPVVGEHRMPGADKRLPKPDAAMVAPATFNTVNKLAAGIADTYPLSVLCEVLSTRRPLVIVPFVSESLAGHPAWLSSLAVLRHAGARLIDARTGRVDVNEPLISGSGDAVAGNFLWTWLFNSLDR
jgi:phosphopantothenoylcysteine synthetase/decarboxylase